jgi:hypothetical protein
MIPSRQQTNYIGQNFSCQASKHGVLSLQRADDPGTPRLPRSATVPVGRVLERGRSGQRLERCLQPRQLRHDHGISAWAAAVRRGARARVWWCVARRVQARSSWAWMVVTSARVGIGVPPGPGRGDAYRGGDLRTAPTAQGPQADAGRATGGTRRSPTTFHRAALPAHRLHQAASSSGGSGRPCGLIVMGHSSSRGGDASREERCASHASRSSRATSSINGEHHPCYDGSRGVLLPREEATPSCCPSTALGAQTPGFSSSRCVEASSQEPVFILTPPAPAARWQNPAGRRGLPVLR